VFEIDMLHCPNCSGDVKITAAILERPAIEKIVLHLGLQARAPQRPPGRGQVLHTARAQLRHLRLSGHTAWAAGAGCACCRCECPNLTADHVSPMGDTDDGIV
jgi:hypothetical protein